MSCKMSIEAIQRGIEFLHGIMQPKIQSIYPLNKFLSSAAISSIFSFIKIPLPKPIPMAIKTVVLLALLAFLVSSALAQPSQVIKHASKADDDFTHIRKCAGKMSTTCGNATFFSIFDGKPKDIGTKCCEQVYLMGHKCHKDIVQSIITEEHYNKQRVPAILKRSEALWDHCTHVSRRRTKYCEENLTEQCGEALFYYVFEGRTKAVKPACCEQLMDMGRRCHNNMVESLLKNDDFKNQAKEIRERSKKLWKQCTTCNSGK